MVTFGEDPARMEGPARMKISIGGIWSLFVAICGSDTLRSQAMPPVSIDAEGVVHYLGSTVNHLDEKGRKAGFWIDFSDPTVFTDVVQGVAVDTADGSFIEFIDTRPSLAPYTHTSFEWIRHGYYAKGLAEGIWTTYARNGTIRLLCEFQRGLLITGSYFNDSGHLLATVTVAEDGYRMRKWSIDGSLLEETRISAEVVSQIFSHTR